MAGASGRRNALSPREFSDEAIQDYLATVEVVVLATLSPSGAPLAMPMWFVNDADRLTMLSVDGLAKVRNLERDPRVCVVAEGGSRGAMHGLVLTGEIEFLTGPDRLSWGRRFHEKYQPDVDRLWGGSEIPDNRRVFAFHPRVAAVFGF